MNESYVLIAFHYFSTSLIIIIWFLQNPVKKEYPNNWGAFYWQGEEKAGARLAPASSLSKKVALCGLFCYTKDR